MKKIAMILMAAALLVACAKKGTEQKGPYLAKVGNVKIMQADFDREMQGLPDYAQQMFHGQEGKERFLDEVIKKELLYQEALKKGLDKNPEFTQKLEEFKKMTLISELLEKEIMTKAGVTEQDARNYYDTHKEDFVTTSQIRASHILVKTEEEAAKVIERLGKGEKFEKIAKEMSLDKTSAKNGGDLGFFSRGDMMPEFEKAAAALNVGEVSQPVMTPHGLHIIKVTDKKTGPMIEFERVKDIITQRLAGERQKESFDGYIEGLKKNYKIEINKDAIAGLSGKKEEPAPESPAPVREPAESQEAPKQKTEDK